MYRNPHIEKIIEASKLTNYTKEKFVRPVRPVTSARYIHIRQKPTRKEIDQAGSVTAFFPGHVDLVFSRAETTIAKSLVGPDTKDHPNLSKVLADLGLNAHLTLGHAPELKHAESLQRTFKTLSSMGVDYHNIEYKAQPWYADYFAIKGKTVEERDLGELRPAHVALLLQIANEQLRRNYSLGGASKAPPDALWTIDEFTQFFTTGVAPAGADNCCDFIARCLAALARYEAPDTPGLQAFLYQLGFVKQPQDLVELAVAYFKRGSDGFLSFAAPPYKPAESATPGAGKQPPAPARELTAEEEAWGSLLGDSQSTQDELNKDKLAAFRKSSNHAPFAKAFGGHSEVFDAIAKALHEDDSIFDDLFASPKDLAWGSHWFKALGERLSQCTGRQGVAAVMYHKDTYPGRITHVSAIGFSTTGRVSISHHESIPFGAKPVMEDGLAIGTAGIPACSYNTVDLHNRVQNRSGATGLRRDECPVVKSYAASGPPMATFTVLDDFDAFEAFNVQLAAQGQSPLGRQWLYGVDPNQKLAELAASVKTGKLHLTPLKLAMLRSDRAMALHPKLPPPGAHGEFSPGVYTNNCARLTLRALLAGRAQTLQGVTHHEEMDLREVAAILLNSGLMPNTDPLVLDRMLRGGFIYNKEKQSVERHAASFLALGQLSGWSNAAPGTPGTYPPDVDRYPPKDPAADAKARQDGDARLAQAIQKNEQTFIDMLGPKPTPLPSPAWVVHELSPERDKALIEAHVTALSDEDRYLRFGEKALDRVLQRIFAPPLTAIHFGVFDPTGKTMVGLGLMCFPVGKDGPAVDVGFSVVPAQRRKGVAKLAMQWAMCRARNRGMRLLVAQYDTENQGSPKLLASIGNPVTTGRYPGTLIIEMALPEADGASHLLEATHLHLSSAWAKK
ncbi:GNAT family N-acetyltransferase [Hydrogenophaga sp.]|uniref:GNAT family N-acetyltransferase n=1 Tax=Hydrogenophaga sp. TaxID=1904254 RepID=UPI002ABACCB8|nr:GNAT family N-acetyltransferase [Hydrogenophaga sp.]MDZ4397461.1 GNAT family N-acetyltransferase [Hydrogenophaga sp.]